MSALAAPAGARWFTDTRMEILVLEDACTLIRAEAQPASMPPLHVHVDEDEIFYVVDGSVSVHLPGSSVEIGPGETAFAPRGVPHTYRVESDRDATMLVATTSGAFGTFVLKTSVVAPDDGYAPEGILPAPTELTAVAAANGIEILGPPGALPS